jgi:hypothetical protein
MGACRLDLRATRSAMGGVSLRESRLPCSASTCRFPGSPAGDRARVMYDGARVVRRALAFAEDLRENGAGTVRVVLEHQEGAAVVLLAPYSRSQITRKGRFRPDQRPRATT